MKSLLVSALLLLSLASAQAQLSPPWWPSQDDIPPGTATLVDPGTTAAVPAKPGAVTPGDGAASSSRDDAGSDGEHAEPFD